MGSREAVLGSPGLCRCECAWEEGRPGLGVPYPSVMGEAALCPPKLWDRLLEQPHAPPLWIALSGLAAPRRVGVLSGSPLCPQTIACPTGWLILVWLLADKVNFLSVAHGALGCTT